MIEQHSIRNPRVLLGVAVLLCAALVVGCHEVPVAPDGGAQAPTEAVAVSKKCPTPPCGGGGDDGGGSGFTVAMQGGLDAASQVLDSFKENKRQISGNKDVLNVGVNLTATQNHASVNVGDPLPAGCSFMCDDPALDCDVGGFVYNELISAFVSGVANHPAVATQGYTNSIGFDKDAVAKGETSTSCPFTAIQDFEPPSGGGVIIRNCNVTGDVVARVYTVVNTDPANTVQTARRFETDGNEGLGPQDYRAVLTCPLLDEYTVTFAPEQP